MNRASVGAVVIIGLFGTLTGMMLLNGVMLSYLWEWFVVPFGLPSIGIFHALGIAILVSMLTFEGAAKAGDDDAWKQMFVRLVAKAVAFGIAYLASFGVAA